MMNEKMAKQKIKQIPKEILARVDEVRYEKRPNNIFKIVIKPKDEKVSNEILERTRLFRQQLNIDNLWEDDKEWENETYQEYLDRVKASRLTDHPTKPNKMQISIDFEKQSKTSLEYQNDDIIEVKLFKAAMKQDRSNFIELTSSPEINSEVQTHVLSFCVIISCVFRDEEVLQFLSEVTNNITDLSLIGSDGYKKIGSPIEASMAIDGLCNPAFIPKKIINLLLTNGLDLNQSSFSKPYGCIIESTSEEFAIEMLEKISDINSEQYYICYHYDYGSSPDNLPAKKITLEYNYYLLIAVQLSKFKLAKAMVEFGAKTDAENSSGASLISFSSMDRKEAEAQGYIDFIQYLFGNDHITQEYLINYQFPDDLFRHYEVAKTVINSGLLTDEIIQRNQQAYDAALKLMAEEENPEPTLSTSVVDGTDIALSGEDAQTHQASEESI